MQDFEYTAKTKEGEVQKGVVEADSEYAAAKVLFGKDLIAVKVRAKSDKGLSFFKKLSSKDKAFLMRQLATTINAGLPISQALKVLGNQTNNKKLKNIISQISSDVEGGQSLSTAFSRFPETFSQMDITLIESGETSGTLDKVLIRVANTMESNYRIKKKIRSAMAYPGFILGVVIVVLIVMNIYVLPQMGTLYKEFNATLPLPTRIVMAMSKASTNYGILLVIAIVAAVTGLRLYVKRTKNGRSIFDTIKLKIPVLGAFIKSLYLSRFTTTLSGLIASGVSLVEAINITSRAIGNIHYEETLGESSEKVKGGVPLSETLKESELFPPIVPQMISVGEQTGEMDGMLENLANYYEEEVDNFVKSMTSIIEPVLIVVIAVLVGGMLVSVMLPIYSLGKVIG